MSASCYTKRRYAVSSTEWTPIAPPYSCNAFALKNSDGAALLLRTIPDDPNTEDYLAAYAQEIVNAPRFPDLFDVTRFSPDIPIVWVKTESGIGPVVVTWVR